MAEIVLDGITKRFADGYEAVKDMDLEIEDGEFMILVGPSGCGKSTALRMIAGLEDITEGELRIGGDVVNQNAPKDRDIAMVFQNYALYPHMTVRENMAFPLKLAKVARGRGRRRRSRRRRRSSTSSEHLDRKPANLSGGQRQRVAMGRAIVRDPKAFLMDEPLSNLDAKLRVQMRTEVSPPAEAAGHDDRLRHPRPDRGDDARRPRRGDAQPACSSRSARRPSSTRSPKNLFVAGFIGSPAMNFMPAQDRAAARSKLPFGEVALTEELRSSSARASGRDVIAGIRPENFEDASLVGDAKGSGHTLQGHDRPGRVDGLRALRLLRDRRGRRRAVGGAGRAGGRLGRRRGPRRRAPAGGRPPRRRQQGRARRGGRALARHRGAPLLRPESGNGSEAAPTPEPTTGMSDGDSRESLVRPRGRCAAVARRCPRSGEGRRSSSRSRSITSSSQAWVRSSR